MTLKLDLATESWTMTSPFQISGYTFHDAKLFVARLSDGAHEGRGEAAGVYYLRDMPADMAAQIEPLRSKIEAGLSREQLREELPPCGARNALDCAMWELESNRSGKPVWQLAGLAAPKPLVTTHTLGADKPEIMAGIARNKYRDAKAIKIKLLGDDMDAARVRAIRGARPDVWLGVDANQGFTPASLVKLMPTFTDTGVKLIEQPFKIGEEAQLDGFKSSIPIAADESVQSLKDVAGLVGRFQVMNIKLDKCGGLTEGLMMAREGQRLGLKIMVGNMIGTSLAMAPGLLVGQFCDVVDLDGPLFLKNDRISPIVYDQGMVSAPTGVWGA